MSDEKEAAPEGAQGQKFNIKGQYIKDLSFENPHAPHSLLKNDVKPAIDVSVNVKAQKLQDGVYELALMIAARAMIESDTTFLVELTYAGIFQLDNIPEEQTEGVMLVDCPFILFPFARRVIADTTRDGGFPPLMLDPIDFHALYLQNKKK